MPRKSKPVTVVTISRADFHADPQRHLRPTFTDGVLLQVVEEDGRVTFSVGGVGVDYFDDECMECGVRTHRIDLLERLFHVCQDHKNSSLCHEHEHEQRIWALVKQIEAFDAKHKEEAEPDEESDS